MVHLPNLVQLPHFHVIEWHENGYRRMDVVMVKCYYDEDYKVIVSEFARAMVADRYWYDSDCIHKVFNQVLIIKEWML